MRKYLNFNKMYPGILAFCSVLTLIGAMAGIFRIISENAAVTIALISLFISCSSFTYWFLKNFGKSDNGTK